MSADQSAYVIATNRDGNKALIAASRIGNRAAVKVLLAGCASTVLRNGKRATAADVGRDRGFGDLAELIGGKGNPDAAFSRRASSGLETTPH